MSNVVHLFRVSLNERAMAYEFGVDAARACLPFAQRHLDDEGMRDFLIGLMIGATEAYERHHGTATTREFLAFLGGFEAKREATA